MTALYLLLISAIFLLLLLHWYQTKSYTAKLLNEFPGPWMPPLVGHPVLFSTKLDEMYLQIRRVLGSYKETFRAWGGPYASVHVVTAEDAEIILTSMKYIRKAQTYELLRPWIGDGLLLSTGDKWQHRRKILTPAFHFNILRKFVTIFGDHCEEFTQKLDKECLKTETDIVPLVNQMTLGNICETAMGTKLDENNEKQGHYLYALYRVGKNLVTRFFVPLLYNDIIFNWSPLGIEVNRYISILHKFTKSVIMERKMNFKEEDVMNLEEKDDLKSSKKRLAMLDLLIYNQRTENNIDDEGIQEEVDTFMFEGHDTTSVAARFMLMTLAKYPSIQENIISEMDSIFGDSKRRPTYDDLQEMKYSELVIKESLRMYPSVFFIARSAEEDIKLTKHTVPTGTEVFIHIYNIHRDPRYFPDPEKFDPDRFLPENSKGRHPYAYIPFSAGPRNCIGQKFAMLELKCILAAVFRNFRLKAIDEAADLTWIVDFVLRSKGSIRVKFERRNT